MATAPWGHRRMQRYGIGGGRGRQRQTERQAGRQTGTERETGILSRRVESAGSLCPLHPWGTSQNATLADRGGREGETDRDRQTRSRPSRREGLAGSLCPWGHCRMQRYLRTYIYSDRTRHVSDRCDCESGSESGSWKQVRKLL